MRCDTDAVCILECSRILNTEGNSGYNRGVGGESAR